MRAARQTSQPPDCRVTPSGGARHTSTYIQEVTRFPSRRFLFEVGGLGFPAAPHRRPAGFPDGDLVMRYRCCWRRGWVSFCAHTHILRTTGLWGWQVQDWAVQPVMESHRVRVIGSFCTQALHGRVSSAPVLPSICSIPPCPHRFVLPARADHLPVGRPVDGVDLTNQHVLAMVKGDGSGSSRGARLPRLRVLAGPWPGCRSVRSTL